ncbi:hypothetical protein GTY65_29820 [Streptomyces sp. SID8379]|uniref:hypothetical protein n=1 Tax=unclassified Streptomyces TaxID=2593676 RepID=UPI00035EC662|nr:MULTISPECIES: hypothetical protein [unclassified Streptomyces]MYW68240.1 hypothetical protein [Streptomyces sp. SID8379]
MQEKNGQSVLSGCERAETLLRAGELRQARAAAQAGIEEAGPHAALYLVLARAHAAEDDDDHDTAAEHAYRTGLDAFPDDLDLLAAYAEFGAAADGVEHPGRLARGKKAAERLRELAPDSPQAWQLGRGPGPKPPSEARVQRYDVRILLDSGVTLPQAAATAAEAAAAWPYDRRLAVRAETLAALARPIAAPARVVVRRPYLTALVLAVAASALLLTVTAFALSPWVLLAVLVLTAPVRQEQALLRGARRRALDRLPVEHRVPAPGAPGLPPLRVADKLMVVFGAAILVTSASGAIGWNYARSTAYPHYEAEVPRTFHGLRQLKDNPTLGLYAALMNEEEMPPGGRRLLAAYGEEGAEQPAVLLFGATGDLHDVEPGELTGVFREGVEMSGRHVTGTWNPAPGRLGGRVECLTAEPLLGGAPQGACTWADRGSFGTVLVSAEGMSHAGIARVAAELREQTLTPEHADEA